MNTYKTVYLVLLALLLPHVSETLSLRVFKKADNIQSSDGRKKFDAVGFGAHVGAVVSATFEVAEDLEGVGHGHGMLLLCGSKLCREVNVMREAINEETEKMEGASKTSRLLSLPLLPFVWFFRLLSTKFVSTLLAIGAFYAAGLEVMEDFALGGHHGAILLASNELIELLIASRLIRGKRLLHVLENHLFRLLLVSGATFFALLESFSSVVKDVKVGAHHGVVILAASKLFRILGLLREEMKAKDA